MQELTAEEYLASPFSKADIERYRSEQLLWNRSERIWSIAFLSVANIPLVYVALTSGWVELILGGCLVAAVYVLFKLKLSRVLDAKYPCRIVINGFPFVSPQDIKSLQDDSPLDDQSMPKGFSSQVKALNRPILHFEKELLLTLNTANQ